MGPRHAAIASPPPSNPGRPHTVVFCPGPPGRPSRSKYSPIAPTVKHEAHFRGAQRATAWEWRCEAAAPSVPAITSPVIAETLAAASPGLPEDRRVRREMANRESRDHSTRNTTESGAMEANNPIPPSTWNRGSSRVALSCWLEIKKSP